MSRLSMSTLGIKPGLDDEHEPMSNIIGSLHVIFFTQVCVCVWPTKNGEWQYLFLCGY